MNRLDTDLERAANAKAGLERQAIIDQRRHHLVALGCPGLLASLTALDTDVDVHDVQALVGAGCPIRLAIRLAPDREHRPPLCARKSAA